MRSWVFHLFCYLDGILVMSQDPSRPLVIEWNPQGALTPHSEICRGSSHRGPKHSRRLVILALLLPQVVAQGWARPVG